MAARRPATKSCFTLVTGDEFLRRQKIASYVQELLPPDLKQTNLHRLYPDDVNWPSILTQASTPSLLGGAQVFWFSQVERIKKGDWSSFESYCKQPVPEATFIFEATELTKSHVLVKLATRFGTHIHFGQKSQDQGLRMLQDKLRRSGKKMTSGAWRLLLDRLGASTQLADMCLDQLIVGSDLEQIDEPAVEAMATEWLKYDVFDLTEAIAQKNISQSLKIFRYLASLSGDQSGTIGLVHWQLKRLWRAKKALQSGAQPQDVSRLVKVSSYRLNHFLSQVKQFQLKQLEALLGKLWELDWKIKTGQAEAKIGMESFFLGIQ